MVTEAAAGRAPHSSAAEAGRCVVNEAGLWEGKGQAQPSAAVLQDGVLAPPLLQAHQVILGRWSLLPCFSERCLWVLRHFHTHEHCGITPSEQPGLDVLEEPCAPGQLG